LTLFAAHLERATLLVGGLARSDSRGVYGASPEVTALDGAFFFI